MLHAAHKALAVDRVAAVAGKAFAPVLRAAFELCGKVRLADERVQIERRLLPRAAVEVDAADLRSVHAAAFVELQQRRQVAAAVAVGAPVVSTLLTRILNIAPILVYMALSLGTIAILFGRSTRT